MHIHIHIYIYACIHIYIYIYTHIYIYRLVGRIPLLGAPIWGDGRLLFAGSKVLKQLPKTP